MRQVQWSSQGDAWTNPGSRLARDGMDRGCFRRWRVLAVFLWLALTPLGAGAVEPGFELVKACRANLTMLNEATASI